MEPRAASAGGGAWRRARRSRDRAPSSAAVRIASDGRLDPDPVVGPGAPRLECDVGDTASVTTAHDRPAPGAYGRLVRSTDAQRRGRWRAMKTKTAVTSGGGKFP
jgi:hypothetical protein